MPNLLDAVTVPMGGTKSYTRREVQWFPFDENGEAGLIIRLWHDGVCRRGRRRGCSYVESGLYIVAREDPPVGQPGKLFAVHKVDPPPEPGEEGPYRTFLGACGLPCRCTCKAGRCMAESDRHVDALLRLQEEGLV